MPDKTEEFVFDVGIIITGCRPKSSPLDCTASSRPSGTAVYAGADAVTNV